MKIKQLTSVRRDFITFANGEGIITIGNKYYVPCRAWSIKKDGSLHPKTKVQLYHPNRQHPHILGQRQTLFGETNHRTGTNLLCFVG